MRYTLIIFALSITHSALAQDYREYHTIINNAERCFFLDNKSDSAFLYYDSAFSKFDFVFAKDCFVAAQVAYYSSKKYEQYLRKGFENGISPKHLKLTPLFQSLGTDNTLLKRKFPDYDALRKKYLSRINVNILRNITKRAVQEQTHKRLPKEQFVSKLSEHMSYIEFVVKTFGYPGEKLIGLLQADIMAELGYKGLDYTAYSYGKATFDGDIDYVAQTLLTALLLHSQCPYQKLEKYWTRCIINGEIHPEEVALYYDCVFHVLNFPKSDQVDQIRPFGCDMYFLPAAAFRKNPLSGSITARFSNKTVDSMRATLFINSLRVDSAKKEFGRSHGLRTVFDWGTAPE